MYNLPAIFQFTHTWQCNSWYETMQAWKLIQIFKTYMAIILDNNTMKPVKNDTPTRTPNKEQPPAKDRLPTPYANLS